MADDLDLELTEKVLEFSRELTSTVALNPLLRKIAEAAAELTNSESAGILLVDKASDELYFTTASYLAEQLAEMAVPIDHSIAGIALRTGQPVIVPNAQVDPRYYRGVEEQTGFVAHSLLAVPLEFKGRCAGVLEAQNKRGDTPFNQRDVKTLTMLAAHATVAIENAQLVTTLQEAYDQLANGLKERTRLLEAERDQRRLAEALRQAGAALGSTLNLDQVLDRILAQMSRVVAYDAANVMLLEGDTAQVFREHGYTVYNADPAAAPIHLNLNDAPLFLEMQRSGQPLIIPEVEKNDRWRYATPERMWMKSYVGVPIQARDKVIGFLNVNSASPNFFSQEDAEHLQAFADHVAIAIENATLYQQAQQEIDKRRQMDQELQRHREHLEALVNERTLELTHANVQLQQEIVERERTERVLRKYAVDLEQSNEELDAFAHTVAHDLKGSIAIITGYAELCQIESAPEQLPEKLQTISRNARKMADIIDALLLLANVRKQAQFTIDRIDMASIVDESCQRLFPMIEEYAAEIVLPETWPQALGYAPWIEEVWVNYISNAVKYGGQPPRVELGATPQSNAQIRFWVRDNGPGITYEEQRRLFTPFTQLGQRKSMGHGLGLSIVHRIIERLGGSVGIESKTGQGSTFSFTLPAEHP
ncbi:MAG: GAF domain-containing protein [Anaerolineae bacterium]|nr:GAF domain-containing protein [Anaerolineae bacterium]